MIYVNFTDETKTAICGYFGCEQDPTAYPNQGTVESNDPMWKTFYDVMSDAGLQFGLPAPT